MQLTLFSACFLFLALACAAVAFADQGLDVDAPKPGRLLMHFCELNGTPIRPLVQDVELRHKFDRQGTPDISADGKWVAFDAWPSDLGFAWEESRIIVVNIDGTGAKDISDGVMPSFSPDAKRLVVNRPPKYAAAEGATGMSIWLMNADGTDKRMIADRGAWGGRWSREGESIIFHGGRDENGKVVPQNCLRIYDVENQKTRTLFTADEAPFEKMSFHYKWSKTGRLVAFTGTLKDSGKASIAVIDLDKGVRSLQLVMPEDTSVQVPSGTSLDWHPDGNQIAVTAFAEGKIRPYCVAIDRSTLPAQFTYNPVGVAVSDPCFTPDGKNIIAAFQSSGPR